MPSIFLSHNRKDKAFVRRIASELAANGVKVWLDEAEMKPGDSLIRKISEGIQGSRFLGVVLSPESVRSRWVRKEVEIAATMEITGRRLKIIPMLLKDCKVPVFLQDKLYADFRHKTLFKPSILKMLEALIPGGFREKLFSIVRGAINAEVTAYRKLPNDDLKDIDRWFTPDGSARQRIVRLLEKRRAQHWVVNDDLGPVAHQLLDIQLKDVKGDEAIVTTEEYMYLRWYSVKERRVRYFYDEKNTQTYVLKRRKGKWLVNANIYPQPTSSRMLK